MRWCRPCPGGGPESGRTVQSLRAHTDVVSCLALSDDGSTLGLRFRRHERGWEARLRWWAVVNPSGTPHRGVPHARLGTVRALVFHSGDGLDECSIGAPTHVADVSNGEVTEYEIDPAALGLRHATVESLQVRDLDHAATLVLDLLQNRERGPALDMTLLNAAAAIVAAGVEDSFEQGIGRAREVIGSGAAAATLAALIKASHG